MTWCKGLAIVALAVASFVAGGAVAGAAGAFSPSTIVRVEGSARNGFDVTHLDGSGSHTPSRYRALTECRRAYPRGVERAICRYAVGATVRRYADLKRTIRYIKTQ